MERSYRHSYYSPRHDGMENATHSYQVVFHALQNKQNLENHFILQNVQRYNGSLQNTISLSLQSISRYYLWSGCLGSTGHYIHFIFRYHLFLMRKTPTD